MSHATKPELNEDKISTNSAHGGPLQKVTKTLLRWKVETRGRVICSSQLTIGFFGGNSQNIQNLSSSDRRPGG